MDAIAAGGSDRVLADEPAAEVEDLAETRDRDAGGPTFLPLMLAAALLLLVLAPIIAHQITGYRAPPLCEPWMHACVQPER